MKHVLIKLKDEFKLEQGQKGLLIGRRLIVKSKFQLVQLNQKELALVTEKFAPFLDTKEIVDKKLFLKVELAKKQKEIQAK